MPIIANGTPEMEAPFFRNHFLFNICRAVLLFACTYANAQEWPQWRGPAGIGVTSHRRVVPTRASLAYEVALPGIGKSSPIVSDGRVFLSTSYQDRSRFQTADALGQAFAVSASLSAAYVALRRRRQRNALLSCVLFLVDAALVVGSALALVADFQVLPPVAKETVRGTLLVGAALWLAGAKCALSAAKVLTYTIALAATGACSYVFDGRYSYSIMIACVAVIRLDVGSPSRDEQGARPYLNRTFELRTASRVALAVSVISFAAFTLPDVYWPRSWAGHVWLRTSCVAGLGLAASLILAVPRRKLRFAGATLLWGLAVLVPLCMPNSGWGVVSPVALACSFGSVFVAATGVMISGFSCVNTTANGSSCERWAGAFLLLTSVLVFARGNFRTQEEQTIHAMLCYDAHSGRLLWNRELHRERNPQMGGLSSMSATPAARAGLVAAHFGSATGVFTRSGDLLWKTITPDYFARAVYGVGSSPLLADDSFVLLKEVESSPTRQATGKTVLGRYHTRTGKTIWLTEVPSATNSYSTPVVWRSGGRRELIFASLEQLRGVDFESGVIRWSLKTPGREVVSSLAVDRNSLFLAGGSAKGVIMAVNLELRDARGVPTVLWQQDSPGMVSSPVAAGGLLFTLTEDGELACRRASSGRVLWSEFVTQGSAYASLVLANSDIYVVDSTGRVVIVGAAATFDKHAEYDLGEVVYATPAFAYGRVWIRTETRLVCFGNPQPGQEGGGTLS